MIVPIQDIQGLVYNEYIDLNNALKILKNWDDIISKLPDERKRKIEEKRKEFDFLISLKKICKNKSPVNNVSYLPSKNQKIWDDYSLNLHPFKIYRKNLEGQLGLIITI